MHIRTHTSVHKLPPLHLTLHLSFSLPTYLSPFLTRLCVSIIGELEEQFKALPESKSEKMNFRTTYPNRVRRDPRFSR